MSSHLPEVESVESQLCPMHKPGFLVKGISFDLQVALTHGWLTAGNSRAFGDFRIIAFVFNTGNFLFKLC